MRKAEFIALVADLLKTQSTLALATSAAGGSPRIAPLFYLPDGLALYWFSSPSSVHSRNLRKNSAAAVAVYRPTAQWREIRGVQMRGAVSVIAGARERQAVEKAYAARFRLGTRFAAELARSRLYVFRPNWVRYLDNSRRAGYKIERSL